MIIGQICIKIKSGVLIRLLMGQFNLIMVPIKCLINFKN